MTGAAGGIATFSGVSIDRVGAGYQLTAASPTLTDGVSAAFDITNARLFLPAVINAAYPDLVGSFSLSTGTIQPGQQVIVVVTITNRGDAPVSDFWVDFYINPAPAPTDTNQRWDQRCSMRPCYGIAWYVDGGLAPGQSITLTSTPDSYSAEYTRWVGAFPKGTKDLYLYVDSWNPGVAEGAVAEADETNNRAEYHVPSSAVLERALDANSAITPEERVPPRPARP